MILNYDVMKIMAMDEIRRIQNGSGVNRDIIPDGMKGSIAKDNWNDGVFTLGVEYGAIAVLMNVFNIKESDLE